mmetsp:Transcript_16580/g.29844  ORF Transcript_16580/g.29844 Transcript_16580/m.29844 type:complete len:259 (+) Transcript_16580:2171-2947(+)
MDRSTNLTPEAAPYPQSQYSSDLRLTDVPDRSSRPGFNSQEVSPGPEYRLIRRISRRSSRQRPVLAKQDILRPNTSQNQQRELRPTSRWKSTVINEEMPLFVPRQTRKRSTPRGLASTRGNSKLEPLATLAQEMKRMFEAMPTIPKPRLSKSMRSDANTSLASQKLNTSGIEPPVSKRHELNVSTNSRRSRQARGFSVPKKPTQPYAPRTPASVSARRGRNVRTKELDSAAKVFEDFYAKSKLLLSELEQKVLGVRVN